MKFYDATHGERPVVAVVQVTPSMFHGFSAYCVGRDMANLYKVSGFWRLKERKA